MLLSKWMVNEKLSIKQELEPTISHSLTTSSSQVYFGRSTLHLKFTNEIILRFYNVLGKRSPQWQPLIETSIHEQFIIPALKVVIQFCTWSSASVGFCPMCLRTAPSSFDRISPSWSVSKRPKASWNSPICSSVKQSRAISRIPGCQN